MNAVTPSSILIPSQNASWNAVERAVQSQNGFDGMTQAAEPKRLPVAAVIDQSAFRENH